MTQRSIRLSRSRGSRPETLHREIYFNEKGEIVDAECDCAAYDAIGDCKHITAVLLTPPQPQIKPAEEALVEELLGSAPAPPGDGSNKARNYN